jgi:hypothetical protein
LKEKLEEDNIRLRTQVQKLKVDFENSESVQHDFVKLSQALQVGSDIQEEKSINSSIKQGSIRRI